MSIFAAIWLACALFIVRYALASERTSDQRFEIIDWVYADAQYVAWRHAIFEKVTHEHHFWCVFVFGDPYKLYERAGEELYSK